MDKLTFKETATSIILEIPKALIKKAKPNIATVNSVLKLVASGRKEYRNGKTKTFNSIKELLSNA